MISETNLYSQSILRDFSTTFSWYIIPFLLIVIYIYAKEFSEKNYSTLMAGFAFLGQDLINEIINSLVFFFTKKAPLWGTSGNTAGQLLIGLNIEIFFMFAIMGISATKLLPNDKTAKILGINNRIFTALLNSLLCVIVECWLSSINVLTWEYPYWSTSFPLLVFIFGYLPFFSVCYYVYDANLRKQKTFLIIQWGTILLFLTTLIPANII
ncbi:MAG: hypothetical protein KC493_16690 [Bacteriovoracaceae bacterium]|nr:hypothetical protein [Bacteriovoracaceae bacterium]